MYPYFALIIYNRNAGYNPLSRHLEINMPFGLQPIHLILIVIVALLIFGPSLLPELGRILGKTIGELRHIARETTREAKDGSKIPVAKSSPDPSNSSPDISIASHSGQSKNCALCGTANPPQANYCNRCGIILPR